jgi:hypothetical protein
LTYQQRPSSATVYAKTDPGYRRTGGQDAQRVEFAVGASLWHTFSQAVKDLWDDKAQGKRMSGYNYYVGLYLNTGARPFIVGQGVVGRDFIAPNE